jgi:hypothetical protein
MMDVWEYCTKGSFWTYKSKTESYMNNQSVSFTIFYQVDPIEGGKTGGTRCILTGRDNKCKLFMGNTLKRNGDT